MELIRELFRLALLAFILTSGSASWAGELNELYRSPRLRGMGGAGVALVDDEDAIWINAAGLAGNTKTELKYFALEAEASPDSYSSAKDLLKVITKGDTTYLNQLNGKNVYVGAQAAPSLIVPRAGISFIADEQMAVYGHDVAQPTYVIGNQTTYGIQGAVGTSLLNHHGRNAANDLRVGIAGKYLLRRGGYKKVPLTTILSTEKGPIDSLFGKYAYGVGVDLGMQYVRKLKKGITLSGGWAWTDIGDTSFLQPSQADPIIQNVSVGVAGTYEMKLAKVRLALDFRHVFDKTDWRKKFHIGGEVSIPGLHIYAGWYEIHHSLGLGVDFWLVRANLVSYAEEIGSFAKQQSERRYMLSVDFKLGM